MHKDLPGYNIERVKKTIRELQERYEKEIKPKEKEYNESNTRKDFIEPILRVLNWDTVNKNEVDAEFPIKNKRSSGSADYALKIKGEVKLLLEAKAFNKDLETGYDIIHGQKRTYVEQLVGYAFDLNRHMKTKIDYCILTNGKEWRIYNVQWQGVAFDKKLVFLIKIEELLTKFRKFWSLEKGNVAKGDIDRFVMEEDKLPIDRKAVSHLLHCKKLLVDSIIKDYDNNKRDMKYMINKLIDHPIKDALNGFPKFYEMPEDERFNKFVLEASSNVINKILFIRIIEDKGYLKPKLTKRSVEEWKSWFSQADRVIRLFREACHEADEKYNGGIFDITPFDTLNYDNEVLDKIIGILGDFNFEEIDADVIGRIYEIYLGTILDTEKDVRGKKRTKLSADYTERKKLGQYYTPKFVVDYIVRNTLGRLLEGKTPEEVSKIKVLDPACGSGSFLIRAFDYLKDYCVRYNDQQMEKIRKKGIGNMNNYIEKGTIIDYNHKILKENLHGVDLNDLSIQICSINLWLRALEKDKKLEKLSKNILHGNSLITGVEGKEELAKYKAELRGIAKLREKIKDYYGRELNKKEQDELEEMELKLRELRQKVNTPLNENLKEYFDNLDLVHPFNWEVELTEVFDPDKSEEEQGFDVVIGNPPWGAKFSDKLLKYLKSKNLVSATIKNTDSYLSFIEVVTSSLKKKGYFAFIVPDTFLRKIDFAPIRKFILENFSIKLILETGNVFEETKGIEDVIFVFKIKYGEDKNLFTHLILSKERTREERLQMIHNNAFDLSAEDRQEDILSNFAYRFGYFPGKNHQELINKLEETGTKLGEIEDIHISRGSEGGKSLILSSKKDDNYYPILIPGDINRYESYFAERYFPIKDSPTKYERDKIFVIRIRNQKLKQRIIATLDTEKLYCLKTLQMIYLKDKSKWDLKAITGILNSNLINYYCKYFLADDMNKEYLETIPLVNASKNSQFLKLIERMLFMKKNLIRIQSKFDRAFSNQPIPDEKACKFAHYWDHGELYDFSKETIPFANKTKAKILDIKIIEENDKLIIYTTNISLAQNKKFENIKTIELTIKNDILRKFLYYSFKKYINEKKGRGFGSGIILEVIKKIPVSVYVVNAKMNLDKIKKVMNEFDHETKDLWKIDGKKYTTLTEIEEDIEKTDKEIDEMVYKLYGITEKEKKIIEESLK